MPRTLKSSKFFLYAPAKRGYYKNKMLFGINVTRENLEADVSVKDLVDFLTEKNIDLSKVNVPNNFTTIINV